MAGTNASARSSTSTASAWVCLANGCAPRRPCCCRCHAAPCRAELGHEGWQLSATWFLTDEDATYRGLPRPNQPFVLGGEGWGGFELVDRIGALVADADAFPFFSESVTSAEHARSYTVGLNWCPTTHAKLFFHYSQTEFDGGAPAGRDRDDEKTFISRLQLAF